MESNQPVSLPDKNIPKESFITRMMDNPVIAKEFTAQMRSKHTFILLIGYLTLISIIILFIYGIAVADGSSMSWDPEFRQGIGKVIFSTVVIMELALISFIGPGLTAGAITTEREHQTFDLLRTTLLSARSFVVGKLGSSFSFLFVLIIAALPIQGFAFLLGGVEIEEVIVSLLMLITTALAYCALGIFFSSIAQRTLTATVSSYASIVLSIFIMGITLTLMASAGSSSMSQQSPIVKNIITLGIWFLISTNSILAAIVSEVILIDQQSLLYTQNTLFGNSTSLLLISPWIIYILTYSIVTIILILASIYFVNKPDQ